MTDDRVQDESLEPDVADADSLSEDILDSKNLDIDSLRQQVASLTQEKADLECTLETIITHSDAIENQLHQVNQSLQQEIIERQRAELALRGFLQAAMREKADLEAILETVNVHGDGMMDLLYDKLLSTTIAASTDALTQLANRRSFDAVLEQEWQKAVLTPQPLAMLICDVDDFKGYNDTYGHTVGDWCLRQVAEAIRSVVSDTSDLVARYGGEEFAVILPNVNQIEAMHIANAIHGAIQQLRIAHGSSSVSPWLTISIGVSSQVPQQGSAAITLTIAADKALYLAKRQGRNCSIYQD